ncbi:MAG: GntR family transcriptional regulator [Rhizobiaceae bacterium]|nr:GntR family transcriptional regulator [Rhizobiaceae bacterium]
MASAFEIALMPENWANQYSGPLYQQLRDHLNQIIRSGGMQAGEPLPSEREIAEIADVSRITVRKAVQELVKQGLVVQKQGSGTTIAPQTQRVQQSLTQLTSFTEDMARRGMVVTSTFLEKGLYSPSPEEIMALGLTSDSMVARLSRLRKGNGNPLALERASLSPKYLPDPENVDPSLYEHLARSGHKPSRAIQRISAMILTGEDAELLEIEEGSAGLNIERVSYLPTGQVVEFTKSIYRGDSYDFVAELQIGDQGST